MDSSGFFEAFNAKYLDPEKVANGFIYSAQFEELAGPYHAVLIGPRGSGKTTLLKMLHPAALSIWNHQHANRYRNNIDYSGVFVASDISWSHQLNALGYGRLPPDLHRALTVACFTTHVLISLLQTMIWRGNPGPGFRKVEISTRLEEAIAMELATLLQVKPQLRTFLSLRQALRTRLTEIRMLANQAVIAAPIESAEIVAQRAFIHFDFLDIASNSISLFNDAVNEGSGRWAFLFDELETAPSWIVSQLFGSFRVCDPKVFLKLAISPVSREAIDVLRSANGPAEAHDHRQIKLWYSDRVDARPFCEELWKSLTTKAGLEVSARDALGASEFEPTTPRESRVRSPYGKGGRWHRVFSELASKDRSFRAFLNVKQVNLEDGDLPSRISRDQVLRRAAPIAAVKNFYLHKEQSGKINARKRKTSTLYAGAESIFTISEGNPRWLIALITPLVAHMKERRENRVPKHVQARTIDETADRLIALLRTTPIPLGFAPRHMEGLDKIVERIGTYLHSELMERNFRLDPHLCVTVDKTAPPGVMELLSAGLNRGAVMLVESDTSLSVVEALPGATLRLSYLLAARFGLPLRLGKAVSLSKVFGSERLSPRQAILDIEIKE